MDLNLNSAFDFLNSQFISSVFGGLISGGLTYFGVMISIRNEKKRMQLLSDAEVSGFCHAIATELEAILKRYLSAVGEELEKNPAEEPFFFYYPVFEDYFTVFNSNANMIGKIQSTDLRTDIVQVYTKAKSILDSIRHNNHLVIQYQSFFFRSNHTKNPYEEEQKNLYLFQLKQYAPTLLQMHFDFVTSTRQLISALNQVS